MTDFGNIPDSDSERLLARQYGKILNGEQEIQDISNPIFKILVKARSIANQAETEIPLSDSEATWNRIQIAISENESRNKSNILSLSSTDKWYWAAAVILIAFASIFMLRQFTDPVPQLLAEAGASINVIELADGSRVTLRPNSRLYKLVSTDQSQNYSLNGEGLFEVESDPGKIFSVEAGPGRVVVTGTRFNLTDRDEHSTIHLLEGSVLFETADRARSANLNAGEGASINRDYTLEEPFLFEPDEITGWTQNRLTFRNRQLADIISELEFHYNITIQVPEEVEEITLGGSVAIENREQTLRDLGTVLGGELIPLNDQTYQFRSLP